MTLNSRYLRILAAAIMLIGMVSPLRAGPIVPWGSVWKYLDNGTDQSNAWRSVDFEDDGWASGPGQLGYGDGDEATEVSYGPVSTNKYITTYFRTWFDIADPRAYTNLVLKLIRDDGAIVYLNNVEVFRSNMPAGSVNYLTRATAAVGGSAESQVFSNTISASLLVPGANLLAVEIHQDSPNSSDISFDMELNDGRNDTPIVSITNPLNNVTFPMPTNVTINVSAVDPNGTITNVQLFAGNLLIGQKTSPPFAFVWSNVPPGAHVISASARDNDGLPGSSGNVKFLVGSGVASNLVLIPAGSSWKYFDKGTDLSTAWYAPGYNDSSWSNGLAQLGYGDGDEVTRVSYGADSANKYITTYFRRSFVVSNLTAVSDLVLRLLRDDGAVVYVNGTEAFRDNMPVGAVTYTTLATTSLSAPEESTFIRTNLNKSLLVTGTNVIAVEIHQAAVNSADISFDLELLGTDLPSVVRGPWLQTATHTNVLIKWRTDSPVTSQVRFGTNATNLAWLVRNTPMTNEHMVALTNLSPGKKYFYSVGTTNGTLLGGPEYYFTTSPIPGTKKKTRIWVLGDCGTANVDQFNVRDSFYRFNGTNDLDLMLLLGDNAYNAGLDSEYQAAIFDTYPVMLRKTPLWSTIGNHETDQSSTPPSTIAYYQIFTLPQSGEAGGVASGTEDYYSFDYANIHFVCLDSMTSSRSSTGPMATWLQNDLASTTQSWVVAFWHHPPYSKGNHNSDTETELVQMRQNLVPILENFGVDLVLCGHSHAYERSHLLNGHYGTSDTLTSGMIVDGGGGRPEERGAYVKPLGRTAHNGAVYVVSGSAGKTTGGSLDHPAMFMELNKLGSLYLEINDTRLDAQFIRENDTIPDHFSVIKGGIKLTVARSAGKTILSWYSVTNQTYTIDYRDTLSSGTWTNLTPTVTGTGGRVFFTNTTANVNRYYRVRSP